MTVRGSKALLFFLPIISVRFCTRVNVINPHISLYDQSRDLKKEKIVLNVFRMGATLKVRDLKYGKIPELLPKYAHITFH